MATAFSSQAPSPHTLTRQGHKSPLKSTILPRTPQICSPSRAILSPCPRPQHQEGALGTDAVSGVAAPPAWATHLWVRDPGGRSPRAPLPLGPCLLVGASERLRRRRAAAPERGERVCREQRPRGELEGWEHRPPLPEPAPAPAPPLPSPSPAPAGGPSASTCPPHPPTPLWLWWNPSTNRETTK